MTRTESAGQEHQERAATLAAPTFPLSVEPGTHAEAVESVLSASSNLVQAV